MHEVGIQPEPLAVDVIRERLILPGIGNITNVGVIQGALPHPLQVFPEVGDVKAPFPRFRILTVQFLD